MTQKPIFRAGNGHHDPNSGHPHRGLTQGPDPLGSDGNKGGSGHSGNGGGNGGGNQQPGPKEQSAIDLMRKTLRAWGLGSLIDDAIRYLKHGLSSDEVQLKLENTKQWKVRFAGNEIRKQNGLAELSPAEYLATEASYRQVLTQYGLPEGFYNQHSDFNNWIGGDVSPTELQQRADVAKNQYLDAAPQVRDYWNKLGLKPGDAIAHILDSSRYSLADLQRVSQAAQFGGTAAEYGVTIGKQRAYQFTDRGLTLDQARQAYQDLAQYGQTDQQIAQRFGTTLTQGQELDALALGEAGAQRKRNLLMTEEAAQFGGHVGASGGAANVGANY